mmetsp:Transcript_24124/g.77865  ORF Transcript_24124/g.77865 Transcript_24124/m.77865 type:complete len:203 (+) Transcript_24124:343-951(+)
MRGLSRRRVEDVTARLQRAGLIRRGCKVEIAVQAEERQVLVYVPRVDVRAHADDEASFLGVPHRTRPLRARGPHVWRRERRVDALKDQGESLIVQRFGAARLVQRRPNHRTPPLALVGERRRAKVGKLGVGLAIGGLERGLHGVVIRTRQLVVPNSLAVHSTERDGHTDECRGDLKGEAAERATIAGGRCGRVLHVCITHNG